MIYVIEIKFYGSGSSKLNEMVRSYKTLAMETDTINSFTFCWFTDDKGWNSARTNLEETYGVMAYIYNIKDLKESIISKIFQ